MAEIPIEKLAEKMGAKIDDFIRGVKIKTFNGIIRDTRVKTGRLRGNWQTNTGSPKTQKIDRLDKTPKGVDGGSAQEEVLYNVNPDTVDYITNNLPYAAIWEERDGMIAGNVARIERNMQEQLDETN